MSPSEPVSALVGRQQQLDHLLSDAARAREGESRAVLLCGDAGIGKSRLLEEYLRRTPMRYSALGGCLELGAEGIAFAPFTALLRQLVRVVGGGGETTGGELSRLVPGLGPVRESTDDHGRARLFEAVLTFLEERARPGGLSLVIEDLHWADASTRDLLVFLLRNLGSVPVHLVVSVRSDDLHRTHPLRRVLPELERLPGVRRLDLEPLSRQAVAEQATALRGVAPDPTALDLLLERSGGNPLFVESFLAAPEGGAVPDGPRELLMRRVEPLSASTRKVLGLASVAGDRVEHALLAEVAEASGIGEDDLDEALREAVDARVLRANDTGYVFRHALLAEAVKGDLLPGQRVRAHRRYAEVLDAGVPGLPRAGAVAQLAHHAYAAHDHPRALSAAWEAAAQASAASAYPEHLALLERVLELWELVPDAAERLGLAPGELLLRVCRVAQISGSLTRSVRHATDGLTTLDPLSEPETAARLLVARARAYKDLGRIAALDDLRTAAELLPEGHPERAAVSAATGAVLMVWGRDAEAGEVTRAAIGEARACGDRASEADALITLGSLLDVTGSEEALGMLREGVRIAREIGEVQVEMRGLNNLGNNHVSRFEFEEALALAREVMERRAALGALRATDTSYINGVTKALMDLGRFDQVRAALNEAPSAEGRIGAHLQYDLALLHIVEGDWEAAREATDGIARLLPQETSPPVEYMSYYYMRTLLLVHGPGERLAEAARLLLAGEADAGVLSQVRLVADGLSTMAEVAWRLRRRAAPGDRDLADELAGLLLATLAREDWATSPVGELTLHASRAFLEVEPDLALAHWKRALPLVARASWVMRVEFLHGAFWAAHEAGEPALARELVERVEEQLAGFEAPFVRQQATRMRVALGGSHDPRVALPAGLTPREAEVLVQLAKGLSNREISEALFISAKTVSVHVSNLMGKLGARNRTAAVAKARELGLV
ncbi:helix-turn-helix transcriptional regulator [Nocardiopsis metallicus]|uniref:ATP/maltotriose-dependent transcriptional regulator MalT n=1 Tax=Nocardiopsis metallicus TaxID=179819 RepID=A0A840W6Z9_9ACTN|nr:helix-turn-helix transcriptional regulator [Nocardiopsis metallicus]MBB5491804.1 ATP/maltotriose-dependent transcriptional regulator MalT [Nocardiopsis metallicus]